MIKLEDHQCMISSLVDFFTISPETVKTEYRWFRSNLVNIEVGDSFGVVKFCSLRGEGWKGWERRVKNGVRMKHMIPVDYIEFSFCWDIIYL